MRGCRGLQAGGTVLRRTGLRVLLTPLFLWKPPKVSLSGRRGLRLALGSLCLCIPIPSLGLTPGVGASASRGCARGGVCTTSGWAQPPL